MNRRERQKYLKPKGRPYHRKRKGVILAPYKPGRVWEAEYKDKKIGEADELCKNLALQFMQGYGIEVTDIRLYLAKKLFLVMETNPKNSVDAFKCLLDWAKREGGKVNIDDPEQSVSEILNSLLDAGFDLEDWVKRINEQRTQSGTFHEKS